MPIKTAKRIPRVTRDHIALVLVCFAMSAFGIVGTFAINHIDKQTEAAVNTATIVEVCKKYNAPLRTGLREFFESELERTEHPDPKLLEQFGLTVQEAKELSEERIEQLRYDINVRFKEVPCEKAYK